MSRIDEALRRAAKTGEVSVDASILEQYAAEAPTRPQAPERIQPRRTQAVSAPRFGAAAPPSAAPPAVQKSLEGKLVLSREIPPVSIEQYRRLAAALHDLQLEHGLKILMVSSAVPREGKTLTIVNLALTFSESYQQRVLLIDADLRRPSIHEMFGLPSGPGLADVMRAADSPLPLVEVSPYLSILTAGRADANLMAQLASERIRTVIKNASASFDWVLLDTPPVGLLPDAQLVARVSDGVLFVIAAGATPYPLVQHSIAELGADRIVGTVLNRVEARTLVANDYYGRYYGATVR
jgi:capsular exopolysaccharide synthesis family protein